MWGRDPMRVAYKMWPNGHQENLKKRVADSRHLTTPGRNLFFARSD
jgi:hypothetical protein